MSEVAEIVVPSVGESITEVVVAEWLRPEGSFVAKDEPLVTLETDKVNVDVPSPIAGRLSKILKTADDTATIGEVIGQIVPGEADTASDAAPEPAAAKAAPAPAAVAAVPAATAPVAAAPVMPAAERLMAQHKVSAQEVSPSGPAGHILKEDVQKVVAARGATPASAPAPASAPNTPAPVSAPGTTGSGNRQTEAVRMTPLRKRIAERLVEAQHTAALLTTFNEIDMSNVMALRKRYKDGFEKKYGIKLGFMSFFVKAAIDALKAYPEINAYIEDDQILYHNYYDIGVAVSSDKGLVVPVMRNAELMSFAEVENTISDFGARARANKLKLEELQGGTFTISNGGVFGSLMSTPILNPPQSGILGMHTIQERPVGVEGQIVLRPMMYVALSYDHRIVDGRGAVGFLKRIKDCIESPERMLIEI